MGMIQTNNLVADYRANRDQMKKIKPKTVHGVIITHLHADHCLGLLAAVAMGMQAYIYIPQGSIPILKIMMDDCIKITRKSNSLDAIALFDFQHSLSRMDDVTGMIICQLCTAYNGRRNVKRHFNKPLHYLVNISLSSQWRRFDTMLILHLQAILRHDFNTIIHHYLEDRD